MSKRLVKIRFALLAGVALTLAAGLFLLGGALDGACGNTLVQSEESPDGRLKAVLFERSCGATTGVSSQVSIIGTTDGLGNEAGNVFIAEAGDGSGGSAFWGGPMVELRWRRATLLEVRHDSMAEVFQAVQSLGAVRVLYLPE